MSTLPTPRPHDDDAHPHVAHPLPLVAGVLALALLCGATQIVGAPGAPLLHRAHLHARTPSAVSAMPASDTVSGADLRDGLEPCVMVDLPPASVDAISL